MTAENPLLRFILGVTLIVLLDTIGAIASNRLNFKYFQLIPLSLAIYAVIGYILAKVTNFPTMALYLGMLGLLDGTIGLKISIRCKANMGLSEDQLAKMQSVKTAVMMIVVGIAFGSIGFAVAQSH
jgi:hypothetical protein